MNKIRRHWIFYLLLGIVLLLGNVVAFRALAQTDDIWLTPVNISQSGSAVAPIVTVDAVGTYHVFWQDSAVGFMVSEGDGQTWSAPQPLRLPFTEPAFFLPESEDFEAFYAPYLLIDADNQVHGFWIDNNGRLLYSFAPLAAIADPTSWSFPVALAESAVALDVRMDGNGRFHLSYIRPRQTAQFPAGVYYRSSASGAEWTDGVLIYQSQYLSVTPELAHITLAVSGANLLLGWDDRLLDSVFVAHSSDGGEMWADPVMMDSRTPEDDPDTAGPSAIDVTIMDGIVHVTWQAEHTTERCFQYHQWSRNFGENWQPSPEAIRGGALACPTDGQFIQAQDDLLFLMTVYDSSAYLQLWDGEQWSEPALQLPLAVFDNPVTYRQVGLGCHQAAVLPGNRLLVIGCGGGNDFDVWALERPLGAFNDWSTRFLPTPVWSAPRTISSGPVQFMMPELVAAGDGRLHAFWSQPEENGLLGQTNETGSAIYYTRLNAGQWSPARPVITSPTGKTDQPAVASDSVGNLFVVWSGGESGQIYFSRASADRASSIAEWTEPLPLPSPHEAGGWPDIVHDENENRLYVAYAIPLNEDRGIYLTQSDDGGDTWQSPVQVFDGAAADWQMVGQPHLTLTGSTSLHLIWTQHTFPNGIGPLSLVYARSDDGGQSWSEPEEVAQQPVVWSELAAIGERSLHRVWLTEDNGRLVLSHQSSIDNGLTWNPPGAVLTPNTLGGPAALIVSADGPHLLQLVQNAEDGQQALLEWVWDGARWRPGENLALEQVVIEGDGITAVSAPDGRLGVIYANLLLNETSGQLQYNLLYTERAWTTPVGPPTPLPTLTPTPLLLATDTVAPQPSPTPTLDFSSVVGPDGGFRLGPFSVNDRLGSIVISIIPAIVILIIALIVGVRMLRIK